MMTTPTNNLIRIFFHFGLFFALFFLSIFNVSASSISNVTAGYGYTQYYNGSTSSRSWVTYNSNNLTKYNYDLPNSSYIDIDEFNIRFHITDNFIVNNFYTITFTWSNYDPYDSSWLVYYQRMNHLLKCAESSWSSSTESGSSCFKNSNISISSISNSSLNVTISFTPSKTFYGLVMVNNHSGSSATSYESEGWEIYNLSYDVSTDSSEQIINNQNQNTQNIINNQNTNTQSIINNQNTNNQSIINNQNTNTQSVINNQNTNNQSIINNQNQNTQDIIDNQNANNQAILDSNKENFQSCRPSINLLDISNLQNQTIKGVTITNNGDGSITLNGTSTGFVEFPLYSSTTIPLVTDDVTFTYYSGQTEKPIYVYFFEYYDSRWNQKVNSRYIGTLTPDSQYGQRYELAFVTGQTFDNYKIYPMLVKGSYTSSTMPSFEPFGEICVNKIDETNNAINGINNSLNDSNVDSSTSSADNFFSNFTTETYGLTSVITAPLSFIQSLTSKTCTPLTLPLPYVNRNLELPCMTTIYQQHFGSFLSLYQTITFGIVSYWIIVRIFNLVKDFKNPDHDEIEVMDL